MEDILGAIVPEAGAEPAAAGDAVTLAGGESEESGADAGMEAAASAEDDVPLTTDGEWVFADEVEGVSFRRLGKPAGRVMIVALPGRTLEHIRISEMTAIAAIPSGYQIIEAVLPSASYKARSGEEKDATGGGYHGDVERDIHFLQTVFDRIKAEGIGNIYFMGYDTAVPVGILALKDREIRRAYFVSPDFRVNGEPVFGPWRVETEVLRGSRDNEVPDKDIRHFLKNSRSHLSKIDMGHHMTEEDQLAAFGRWLTGARSGRYVDNGFIIMMAVGLLVGYLAGYLITKNSAVGLMAGAACGIILNIIYKKI